MILKNITSLFGKLRSDRDLTDASTPLFMGILKRDKHPHSLIFMRGLKTDEMLSILDFVYFGEANVL